MEACVSIPSVEAWITLYFLNVLLASLQQAEEGVN